MCNLRGNASSRFSKILCPSESLYILCALHYIVRLQLHHGPDATPEPRRRCNSPERYFDPVELGSFLVSVAALAWQIYDSHRKKGEKPTPPSWPARSASCCGSVPI